MKKIIFLAAFAMALAFSSQAFAETYTMYGFCKAEPSSADDTLYISEVLSFRCEGSSAWKIKTSSYGECGSIDMQNQFAEHVEDLKPNVILADLSCFKDENEREVKGDRREWIKGALDGVRKFRDFRYRP